MRPRSSTVWVMALALLARLVQAGNNNNYYNYNQNQNYNAVRRRDESKLMITDETVHNMDEYWIDFPVFILIVCVAQFFRFLFSLSLPQQYNQNQNYNQYK